MKLKTIAKIMAIGMCLNVAAYTYAEEGTVTPPVTSPDVISTDIVPAKEDRKLNKYEEPKVRELLKEKLKEKKEDFEQRKEARVKIGKILEKKLAFLEAKLKLVAASDKANKEELTKAITAQIDKTKALLERFKTEISKVKQLITEKVKEQYTSEELAKIQEAAAILKKHGDLKVLNVQNVFAKGKNIKFDLPPVIKSGRTLIPIRALSEAYGFDVKWDAATKKITITKDSKVVEIFVDKNEAYVNGEKVELDVPATMYNVDNKNARTVVPLRFIVEKMGLNVNWDSKSETIDIDDEKRTDDEKDELDELDELDAKDEEVSNMSDEQLSRELQSIDSKIIEDIKAVDEEEKTTNEEPASEPEHEENDSDDVDNSGDLN